MSSVSAFLNATTITSNATNGSTWFKGGSNQSINFTFLFTTIVNKSVSVNSINFTSENFSIWTTNQTNSTGWSCTSSNTAYLNCSTVIPFGSLINSTIITLNVTLNDSAYEINHTITINISTNASEYSALTNSNKTRYNIEVDGVLPAVTLPVYTNATIKKNTEKLTLNVSVIDAGSGGSKCYLDVNGTSNQTVDVSNGWCNSTIVDLTGTSDGNKSIKIYVNDSVNNLNLTRIYYVQVDTTNPSPSATCSPSTVQTGASFPCTCSGTDATSGVSTSIGSSTSGSITSTASTGTFTYTCSVTDNAGNSANLAAAYSVIQSPGAGSTNGPTTTTWTTYPVSEELFEQGHTRVLGVKNRLKVQVDSQDHYIGVLSISGTKATIEISSTPVQVILSAGQNASVDVNNDSFYDIYVLLNGIVNNKANVTIQKINEEIPEGEDEVSTTGETGEEPPQEEQGIGWWWVAIIAGAIVIAYLISSKAFKKR